MPSSICWPFGENSQAKVEGIRSSLNSVGDVLVREQSAPVHPAAEIGRDRHIRRRGDDARGEIGLGLADLVQEIAEAGLRRHHRLDRHRKLGRHFDPRRGLLRLALRERHLVEEGLQGRCRQRQAFELVPFVTRPHMVLRAESVHLRGRHQTRVVVLVAGHRQAEALHRVADEADRLVMLDAAEGLGQRRQVVAAEIVHQPRQFVVRALLDQCGDRALIADLVVAGACARPRRPETPKRNRAGSGRHRSRPSACRRPARGMRPAAASRISRSPRPSRNCGTIARSVPTILRARRRRGSGGYSRRSTSNCARDCFQPSRIASKILPSSSSASPTSAIMRPSGLSLAKPCACT